MDVTILNGPPDFKSISNGEDLTNSDKLDKIDKMLPDVVNMSIIENSVGSGILSPFESAGSYSDDQSQIKQISASSSSTISMDANTKLLSNVQVSQV